MSHHFHFPSLILFLSLIIATALSQPQAVPLPNATCNGILLSYKYTGGFAIPPILTPNSTEQPYRFQSVLFAQNNGLEELKNWRIRVDFNHSEYLVSASNAVLADDTSLPADVRNGTVFAGEGSADLKTAAMTAGEWSQMQAHVEMVGTQYGIGPPDVPLPNSIALANDGYICPAPTKIDNELQLCCNIDPDFTATLPPPTKFAPLQNGDITIIYDVTKTYESNYWVQVTISNQSPLSRLDDWHLSWDWTRDEFIQSMRGAHPTMIDTAGCIYGPQGQYYRDLDFSTVLNCDRRPVIMDLPLSKTNDTNVGLVPNCCRDGIILPAHMDATKSKSAFTMQVYKMPPDLNRTELYPPQNFRINGTFNPDYMCGPPVRVNPSLFEDPNGLDSQWTAVASWQVVCNITVVKTEKPKCCVSFSAFYNESVIPCNTCACGCQAQSSDTCSATSSPLLLPSEALLVPFGNRSHMAEQHWQMNKWTLPDPLPCGDNCGVSINWHLLTDFKGEWSSRMTLFNWGENSFADWSAAVVLDKASPGFEKVYSFNGTTISDSKNTIFFQGLPGLNYLLAEKQPDNSRKDLPLPGMVQSQIRFTKKNTPGINVANRDGFPTKVFFNGEECSMPHTVPMSNGHKMGTVATLLCSFVTIVFMFMLF